jgi:hypothetical protein
MDALAEDLALLSLKPKTGHVTNLRFSLMGSELVRLAASRRIDIVGDRIVVLGPSPTGDPELDAALASIAGSRRPPQPKSWVGGPRKRIVENYLARLVAAGTVRAEQRKLLGIVSLTHWEVVDTPRLAAARGRLDAVAHSSGPVDAEQAALGGLAHAAGIGDLVYPGKENKRLRKRLEEVAKSQRTARAVKNAAAGGAGTDAAVSAAIHASTDAVVQAATEAAIHAAVNAAVDAAVYAAVDAASHAAAHSGDGGGGGGGHHH